MAARYPEKYPAALAAMGRGAVSKPRDIAGHERGQAHRDAIRAMMLEHVRQHPLRRPLTGKQIQANLPHLALSTILWHVAAIHAEAEAEAACDPVLESF